MTCCAGPHAAKILAASRAAKQKCFKAADVASAVAAARLVAGCHAMAAPVASTIGGRPTAPFTYGSSSHSWVIDVPPMASTFSWNTVRQKVKQAPASHA